MHLGCTEPSRTWPTQDPPNALSSSTSRQWPSSVAASTNTKTRTPYSHPTLRPDSGSLLLPRWGRGKVRHQVEWYTPLCTLTRWTPKASWTACVDPVRRSKILPPANLMWDPVLCRWIWVPRMMRRRPHRNCRRRRRSLGRRYGRLQVQTGLMGLLVEDCNAGWGGSMFPFVIPTETRRRRFILVVLSLPFPCFIYWRLVVYRISWPPSPFWSTPRRSFRHSHRHQTKRKCGSNSESSRPHESYILRDSRDKEPKRIHLRETFIGDPHSTPWFVVFRLDADH